MLLSILIPIYDEKDNIEPLHAQLVAVLDGLEHEWEVIFVNDGSRDGSPEVLDRLAKKESRVHVIHMRRNYGQTAAIRKIRKY